MKTFHEWSIEKLIRENDWQADISEIAQYLLILRLASPETYKAVVGNFALPIEKAAEGMVWLTDKLKDLFSKTSGAPISKAREVYAALDNREKRQLGIATRMSENA